MADPKGGARVPERRADRDSIRTAAATWVSALQAVPPLPLAQLRAGARELLRQQSLDPAFEDFAVVMLSNALWSSVVAEIPFDRRVLLLPQCLRSRDRCPAKVDEFGVLCERCGGCPIGSLEQRAEELGYVVLIAEGTTVVTSLLETGQVESVVGVSCLHTLERSFPVTAPAAIPSLALVLNVDGCEATRVDEDQVVAAIELRAPATRPPRLGLDDLRREVCGWFERPRLERLLGTEGIRTEEIACDWLVAGGKRWRPVLTAAVCSALRGDPAHDPPLRRLATAVELFHKASLVHDDIEDDDDYRYGQPTVHRRHGMPIALNIGDFLVGEGYRLISRSGLDPEGLARALRVAADGHRALCLGQGEELAWSRHPVPLTVAEACAIFRRKTSPSFEVALVLGAIAADAEEEICDLLRRLSGVLGVAYQVRDDLEDLDASDGTADADASRPTVLLALAMERASAAERVRIVDALGEGRIGEYSARLRGLIRDHDLSTAGWRLYATLREEALLSLGRLDHVDLKCLLHRVVHRVLPEPRYGASAQPEGFAVADRPAGTLPAIGVGPGKVATDGR